MSYLKIAIFFSLGLCLFLTETVRAEDVDEAPAALKEVDPAPASQLDSSEEDEDDASDDASGKWKPPKRCPPRDGRYPVFLPRKDCRTYIMCSNGVGHLFKCPSGLHFNRKLRVCDWPKRAGCRSWPAATDSDTVDDQVVDQGFFVDMTEQ